MINKLSDLEFKEASNRVKSLLHDDECMLWADRPKPDIRIDVRDDKLGYAGVGGIIIFIGVIFFKHSYYDGTFESFMKERFIAVLGMIIGLLIIFLTFYLSFLSEKNTTYLLTNKRLFILKKRKVIPLFLHTLDGFKIEHHSNGYATIKSNPYYHKTYKDNTSASLRSYKRYLFFIKNIKEAEAVLELITTARQALIEQLKKMEEGKSEA